MSLQVPCILLFSISKAYLPGKRVLPFTLQNTNKKEAWIDRPKRLDASITVEAAIVLPLFVFFGLAVLAPMRWLDTQRQKQIEVERLGENLSQYVYLMDTEQEESGSGILTNVLDENKDIRFEIDYQEKIPFFAKEIQEVTMRVAVRRRGWVGLRGKLTSEGSGETGFGNESDMVYVTPEGTRYHRYRDCRYLSNTCEAVSVRDVGTLRNPAGKIFYACEICVKGSEAQNTVYISTWGIRYHNDRSCASISQYFRKVPLEEVAYMGECSVCAGRKDSDAES